MSERVPVVLVVDDEPKYRHLYVEVLGPLGVEMMEAGSCEEALERMSEHVPDLVISDVRMPGADGFTLLQSTKEKWPAMPFLLVTAYASVREAVAALKFGAVDYLAKPLDLGELVACVEDLLGLGGNHEHDLDEELLEGIVVQSPLVRDVFREAWTLAQSDVNLLLTGESGTGKEVLASFVHRHSKRRERPYVAVNCGALPKELVASELFGHERGAFTGAVSTRQGKFRETEGGVLFLDEIGELPLDVQPIFLRVLEQRSVTPVGGEGEVEVDFRLVAATNRSLEEEVREGRFRADLFYRLNVVELHLPPLRQRREEILPLARHFLSLQPGPNKRLARATVARLEAYTWPGNVRELKNAITRAHLLSRTEVVLPESLPPAVRVVEQEGDEVIEGEAIKTLREVEIENLKRALKETGGNRTRAAQMLGITRRGLLKKIKRFGLGAPPQERG